MTLRWLLLASHVPAGAARGGMVRYTVELAHGLAAHPDVELHVLANAQAVDYWAALVGPDRTHAIGAVPVGSVPVAAVSLLERYGIGSRAFRESFDVVQGTKHLVPRSTSAVRVLTVHDLLPLDRPGDFGLAKRVLLPGPYLASARDADVLVCISEATRDRLLSYVPEVAARARVVPLANTSAGLSDVTPQPVAELAGPFALVVGDPSRRKNLPLVVDAWPAVRERVPEARLAVVGPPGWGQASVSSGGVDPGVLMLGRVDDEALRWCYEQATVVLCPSLLEGFGLPSVEGLMAGTPVITSEDPALCEASGDHAEHVHSLDRVGWVRAIVAAFTQPRRVDPPPVRTWEDVAEDTVRAARSAL